MSDDRVSPLGKPKTGSRLVSSAGIAVSAPHEEDRVRSLRSYRILDTPPEAAYDSLTSLAAMLCDAPVAVLALVDSDRLWFKARMGMQVPEAPRDQGFSPHVVASGEPLMVSNALEDERFADLSLVRGREGIRAYVGVPLIGRDGLPLGALGVLDRRPRRFSATHLQSLTWLAGLAMEVMELRRNELSAGQVQDVEELLDPTRLRIALDAGEMTAYFQPVIDMGSGATHGAEALARWLHPTLGTVAPGRFLPAMERSGLIFPLARQMLDDALALLVQAKATGATAPDFGVSVNVSMAQLADPGLADAVVEALVDHGVPARHLHLELTETADMLSNQTALRELHALCSVGVRLAIDDYGTGFSSLQRVLDLPVSTLKLDRFLTQRLPHDTRALTVTRSTLTMARDLGLSVIAEGIELAEQRDCLLDLGCTLAQGFLYAAPMPAADLLSSLRAERVDVPALAKPAATPARLPVVAATGRPTWPHDVLFYERDEQVVGSVADYLLPALVAAPAEGEAATGAAVVIATEDHRAGLLVQLQNRGVDTTKLETDGRLLLADARGVLDELVVDGRAASDRVDQLLVAEFDRLVERFGAVRLYSELSACLWGDGKVQAALDLEDLVNHIGEGGGLSLYCAFPQQLGVTAAGYARPPHGRKTASGGRAHLHPVSAWDRLRGQHRHVVGQ